jgi:hypothetical protein
VSWVKEQLQKKPTLSQEALFRRKRIRTTLKTSLAPQNTRLWTLHNRSGTEDVKEDLTSASLNFQKLIQEEGRKKNQTFKFIQEWDKQTLRQHQQLIWAITNKEYKTGETSILETSRTFY